MHESDPVSTAAAERLRALPQATAEPYGWNEFRRRAAHARRAGARTAASSTLAFRAAAAMLLVCGAALFAAWMWGDSMRPENRGVETRSASSARAAATEPARRPDQLDARARALELWLARQPADPAMVRVGSYAAVAGLEDRIAQLDDLLTSARAEGVQSAGLSPLERQRAQLMSSLAQIRYAQTLVAESPP